MPVQTDTPSGIGSITDWGLYGSAPNKLQAVATNDGDTSLIFASSGGRTVIDLYTFPVLLGVADPVSAASLTSVVRIYLTGGGGRGFYNYWNSAQIAVNRASEIGSSYVAITSNLAGADLVLATVNGQHGAQFNAAGGPSSKAEAWLTHLYRSVTFTYNTGSAGEFAHLIGSLVGTLIGGNLLLREMEAVSMAMGRVRLLPSEYEPAWREWKAQKRAVYA